MQDWRLDGRENLLKQWLKSKKLIYTQFADTPQNDHVHCEFCFEKIGAYEGVQHFGYCTLDKRNWICRECFHDFKDLFDWTAVEESKE